jgi:DNA-binding transcriptional MerR regulator
LGPIPTEATSPTALRISRQTIRYYERSGLLPAPDRAANGYREYGPDHLERLAFIRRCRALDIPLADIGWLLDFVAHPERDCGDIDRLIDDQLVRVRVRVRLASMQALEQQLRALRGRCGERQQAGACGILQELVAAAHGEGCACHGAAPSEIAGESGLPGI